MDKGSDCWVVDLILQHTLDLLSILHHACRGMPNKYSSWRNVTGLACHNILQQALDTIYVTSYYGMLHVEACADYPVQCYRTHCRGVQKSSWSLC